MFEQIIHWCECKKFPWKIIDNRFFWQTNCQTGETDEKGHIKWHNREYFTTI